MTSINRRRHVAATAVAALALLAGASSASADLPSVNLNLKTGALSSEIDSDALRGQVSNQVAGQLGKVGQELRSTQRKLRRSVTRLRSIERRLNSGVRSMSAKTRSDLATAKRRTQRRIRVLRAKADQLSSRALRQARKAQRQAISQAKSTTNGIWLVVNRSGKVLDQSGGIAVSRQGYNGYYVSWSTSRSNCLQFAAGGSGSSPLGSSVSLSPASVGSLLVQVTGSTGSRGSGFYLTAAC
jgi:hypothetical protein